jgi:hypothetical protein
MDGPVREAEPGVAHLLTGGGAMGALMRAHDWSGSPIGRPESWPQPLKTLVGVMLASNQPMFIAWGPARTLLYNDAYCDILAAKHPAAISSMCGRTSAPTSCRSSTWPTPASRCAWTI